MWAIEREEREGQKDVGSINEDDRSSRLSQGWIRDSRSSGKNRNGSSTLFASRDLSSLPFEISTSAREPPRVQPERYQLRQTERSLLIASASVPASRANRIVEQQPLAVLGDSFSARGSVWRVGALSSHPRAKHKDKLAKTAGTGRARRKCQPGTNAPLISRSIKPGAASSPANLQASAAKSKRRDRSSRIFSLAGEGLGHLAVDQANEHRLSSTILSAANRTSFRLG